MRVLLGRGRRRIVAVAATMAAVSVGCGGRPGSGVSSSGSHRRASTVSSTGTGARITADPATSVSTSSAVTARPRSPVPTTGPPSTRRPAAPSGTGAYGYVTAGPSCPVQRSDQPCPPRPVEAHIEVQDGSGRQVAATNSDSSGRYSVTLAPGTYTLTASTGNAYPRCEPTSVTVSSGPAARADITCDTGIR